MALLHKSEIFNENVSMDDPNLKYDRQENSFIWEGTFEELKEFLEQVLMSKEDAEINEDRKHKATSYKKDDLTVRFYHISKKLKLFGNIGSLFIDEIHKHLGTFPDLSQSSKFPPPRITIDSSPLSSTRLSRRFKVTF